MVGVLGDALRATGTTALYVTHDQDEAFALADRVGVMQAGRLLQVDPPDVLWREPESRAVAGFLGYGPFVAGELSQRLGGPGAAPNELVGIGPAALVPDPTGTALPVIEQRYQRGEVLVDVRLPNGQVATVRTPEKVPDGDLVLALDPAGCVMVPA